MATLRALLTCDGRFPCRRTWERRLEQLPDTLPRQIAALGRFLVEVLDPFASSGRAVALDSTLLRAFGGRRSTTMMSALRNSFWSYTGGRPRLPLPVEDTPLGGVWKGVQVRQSTVWTKETRTEEDVTLKMAPNCGVVITSQGARSVRRNGARSSFYASAIYVQASFK